MRPRASLIAIGLLVPIAFGAGWLASRGGGPARGARTVLYYVDPMNPAFHSAEPGNAPCGMPLEPVYADGAAPAAAGAAPPGAVTVRADRLQLVGVAREPVRPRTLRHTLRAVGTVAADESRSYRISAATSGRIREIGAVTTGSRVAKGEVLGSFYAPDLLIPQQNFLRLNDAYRKAQTGGMSAQDQGKSGGQLSTFWRNLDVARQTLMNLGMTAEQLDEVAMRRQPAYLIQLRAPAAGFVTAKNVVLGQSFDAGDELFAFADLSRVWVLADAFEGQEEFFAPGRPATVLAPGSGRRFEGRVSSVLPRFETATRTLKVRIEVGDNPGFALRPDMFVDVEVPVEVGPALFVPQEAVLDSGARKVVFVEQAAGVFVPRPVSTGRRVGGQVEIRGGLMAGETVVTSGNFMLDSESRMRAGGAAAGGTLDPVCGMQVDEAKARAKGLVSEHGGSAWFFCSPECKRSFDRDPRTATARAAGAPPPGEAGRAAGGAKPAAEDAMREPAAAPDGTAHEAMRQGRADRDTADPEASAGHAAHGMPAEGAGAAMASMPVDPVCGMQVDAGEARASGLFSELRGKTWFFCSPECKRDFEAGPDAFLPSGR